MIDRLEVYRAEDGWRWRAKARNHETVGVGEAYGNRRDLLDMLAGSFEGIPIVELDADDEEPQP